MNEEGEKTAVSFKSQSKLIFQNSWKKNDLIPDICYRQMTNINDISVTYPSLEASVRVWTSCPLLLWFLAVWTPPSDTVGKSRALYLYSVLARKKVSISQSLNSGFGFFWKHEKHFLSQKNHNNHFLGPCQLPTCTGKVRRLMTVVWAQDSLEAENSLHFLLVQKRLIGWQEEKKFLKAVASFLVCPDRIEL